MLGFGDHDQRLGGQATAERVAGHPVPCLWREYGRILEFRSNGVGFETQTPDQANSGFVYLTTALSASKFNEVEQTDCSHAEARTPTRTTGVTTVQRLHGDHMRTRAAAAGVASHT